MPKKRILLIDDEQDFCSLVKKNLELIGDFQVDTVTSGKAGLNKAKEIKPDLILLDIIMPDIDGFEVLERLKKDPDTLSIPVVMLTAKGDNVSKIKSMQLYSEDYITKPVGAQYLKAKIEEVLKRR